MLKWLHINKGSGLLWCNHLELPISVILYLPEIITRGGFGGTHILSFFERDPDFANLPKKGSHILTILTRTSMADENLKVSTHPSDDYWMVPYPVYLFIAKLPAWFTWDKTSHVKSLWGMFTWLKYNITHCVWSASILYV